MPTIRYGAVMPLALLSMAALATPARRASAQAKSVVQDSATRPQRLTGAIGLGVATLPRYLGSDEYRVIALPVLQLEYKGRLYLGGATNAVGGGLGAYVVRTAAFTWDVGLAGTERRLERRGDALAGMGDRAAASFLTTGVVYRVGTASMALGGAMSLRDGQGNYGSLTLSNERTLGDRWFGGLSASAIVADAENMAFEFGVTPMQSNIRRALRDAGDPRLHDVDIGAFAPNGGLRDMRGSAMLGYLVSTRSRVLLFTQGTRLSAESARSPLVRTPNAVAIGMAYVRSF